jgi:hypothetical protein
VISVETIVPVLRWRTAGHVSELLGLQARRVFERLAVAVPTLTGDTLEGLVGLSDRQWRRLVFAPEFYGDVTAGRGADTIRGHTLAELGVCGDARAIASLLGRNGIASTALGDVTWIQRGDRQLTITAPSAQGIVVDTMSVHLRRPRSGLPRSIQLYDEIERDRLCSDISGALQQIYGASPTAGVLVNSVVRTIVVRKDATQRSVASCSWPGLPGCVGLVNPLGLARSWLVNSLVHEAVHCYLCLTELLGDWYVDEAAMTARTVRSPWSGRPLPFHSFVHACLVWFGLLNYWRVDQSEDSAQYVRQAARGFLRPRDIVSQVRAGDGLRPEIADLVLHVCGLGRTVASEHAERGRQ